MDVVDTVETGHKNCKEYYATLDGVSGDDIFEFKWRGTHRGQHRKNTDEIWVGVRDKTPREWIVEAVEGRDQAAMINDHLLCGRHGSAKSYFNSDGKVTEDTVIAEMRLTDKQLEAPWTSVAVGFSDPEVYLSYRLNGKDENDVVEMPITTTRVTILGKPCLNPSMYPSLEGRVRPFYELEKDKDQEIKFYVCSAAEDQDDNFTRLNKEDATYESLNVYDIE